jgi:hypothetical protein
MRERKVLYVPETPEIPDTLPQSKTKRKMREAVCLLAEIMIEMEDYNKDGKVFNGTTDSTLYTISLNLSRITDKIMEIINK